MHSCSFTGVLYFKLGLLLGGLTLRPYFSFALTSRRMDSLMSIALSRLSGLDAEENCNALFAYKL